MDKFSPSQQDDHQVNFLKRPYRQDGISTSGVSGKGETAFSKGVNHFVAFASMDS